MVVELLHHNPRDDTPVGGGDPASEDELVGWARDFFDATAPYASDDVYVNSLSGDEQDRATAAYGDYYERLVALKNEWDLENLFSVNQNIDPTN